MWKILVVYYLIIIGLFGYTCIGDLICTSKELTGHIELMLVRNMTSNIHLISPLTNHMVEIDSNKYFNRPFLPLLSAEELVPFVVLDIEVVENQTVLKHRYSSKTAENGSGSGHQQRNDNNVDLVSGAPDKNKNNHKIYAQLAEAWVSVVWIFVLYSIITPFITPFIITGM